MQKSLVPSNRKSCWHHPPGEENVAWLANPANFILGNSPFPIILCGHLGSKEGVKWFGLLKGFFGGVKKS